jgi:hypothetical protein
VTFTITDMLVAGIVGFAAGYLVGAVAMAALTYFNWRSRR